MCLVRHNISYASDVQRRFFFAGNVTDPLILMQLFSSDKYAGCCNMYNMVREASFIDYILHGSVVLYPYLLSVSPLKIAHALSYMASIVCYF